MPQYTKEQLERLKINLPEVDLSVRTTNALEERGILTVGDLLKYTKEDLLVISNFGEKTLAEVFKALESLGFYREGKEPPLEDQLEDPIERRRRIFRESYGVKD